MVFGVKRNIAAPKQILRWAADYADFEKRLHRLNLVRNEMKKNLLKTLIIIFGLGYLMSGCAYRSDVDFARSVLNQLIEGRYAVRAVIDWPSLIMLDQNVGVKYSKLANDKEKLDFQRAFIEGFSRGFKMQGTQFKSFFNWRTLESTDPKIKIAAADYVDKTLVALFFISRYGSKKKLVNFQIIKIFKEGEKLPSQWGEKRDVAPEEE